MNQCKGCLNCISFKLACLVDFRDYPSTRIVYCTHTAQRRKQDIGTDNIRTTKDLLSLLVKA